MNLKRIALLCALSVSVAACGRVPAGNVGVKVNLYGSDKGVNQETLGPGRYWIGWFHELFVFPTFTQNYTWELSESKDDSFTFQTTEGMSVNADVGISYAIDAEKVPLIFQKYRKGVDEITSIYLRNMVRDAIVSEGSKVRIEYVYGAGKEELIRAVEDRVRAQVEPIGIKVEKIYWIGSLRLPPAVTDLINEKIGATQKTQQRQNEVEQVKAEAQKKIEEAKGEAESIRLRAIAEAEANRIVAQSLTDELVKYRAIDKWDGILPKFSGGNATPMIDITKEIE